MVTVQEVKMIKKLRRSPFTLFLHLLFLCVCLALPVKASHAAVGSAGSSPRILFIGNSLTSYNQLPTMFRLLCEAAGLSPELSSVTKSGYLLEKHADVQDPVGAKVYKKLTEYNWDYVIMQDQRYNPMTAPETSMFPAARILDARIRAAGGKSVFYMTWGYETSNSFLIDGVLKQVTMEEMQRRIADSYFAIGTELDAIVSPAGLNFMRCLENYPEITLWRPDGYHPSAEGSYLAACTLFASIFDRSPLNVPYNGDLPVETALALQKIADRRLTIEAENIKLEVGSTRTLPADLQYSPENDLAADPAMNEITWSSSDSDIVSIDPVTGELTAHAPGQVMISASTSDGLLDKCLVSAEISARNLTLTEEQKTLTVGDSFALRYHFAPSDATDTFSFSSGSPDIAGVDAAGNVTAYTPGTAVLSVSGSNGIAAHCTVTVLLRAPKTIKAVRSGTKPSGAGTTNLKITWSASSQAKDYVIYRSNSKNGPYEKIATTAARKYVDKNLSISKMYYYKVAARAPKTKYNSAMSSAVRIRVPAVPELTVKSGKKSRAVLTWKKVKYNAGYEIYRSAKKGAGYKLLKTVTNTNRIKYTDKTRKKKKAYYYKMRAFTLVDGRKIYSRYSKAVKR